MTGLRLSDVDWNAIVAATGVSGAAAGRLAPEHTAQILSLSALYAADYQTAAIRLRQAARLEPFNPLHTLRQVLLLARFGELSRALGALERLKQTLPASPLIDYVRALLALRAGRPEQARAIANTLETAHPNFVYGKFLKADAQIVLAAKISAIEKYLISLPAGPQYESLWADLLTKIALLHPQDGPAQVEKYLGKKIRADSPANAVVRRALAWARASVAELETHLEQERPGSRAEELILARLVECLERAEDDVKAVEMITALLRRHPERRALRQLQSVFVTRIAVRKSSDGEHEQALRLIERCLREQPHDQVYHQNRAALFTLLREVGPYYEAWTALNRHQYRLIILGAFNRFTVAQAARAHRLFAQQARGGGRTSAAARLRRGIFRQAVSEEPGQLKRVLVDQDEIAADPELLRQWIHHSRAELVFRHCLLSDSADRLLLRPMDRDEAVARAEGLSACAESLTTLVPEEGTLLAKMLSARWLSAATAVRTHYNAEPAAEDAEVRQLRLQHLEVLGDLALFCKQWRPSGQQLVLAEELLNFLRTERAFFDEQMLFQAEKQTEHETPFQILVLADHVRRTTGVEKIRTLTPEQRAAVVDSLLANLLLNMSGSAYNEGAGRPKEQVARAMALIDRARACNPADADIELAAARFLIIGEFYDEARAALERFRRLADPEDFEALSDADKIEQILKERWKKGTAIKRRQRDLDEDAAPESGDFRIAELERELDRAPGSWRLYEEIVQELVKAGRFEEAVDWADRAVAHCLSRALQMNARSLAIETRALKSLAETNPRAARLYAVGAHEPARKAIESLAATGALDYTLLFLLGRCQLAAGAPEQARASFGQAASLCERQLHRAVLRHLTDDIDNAYLAIARSAVNAALQDDSAGEAARAAAAVFARLQEPAAWLVDFARVFYSAALADLGTTRAPLTVPRIAVKADWQERLNALLLGGDNVERALAIVALAEEVHQPSRQQARALAERLRTLKRQLAVTDALNAVGRLLTERRFDEMLAMLDQLEPEIVNEPRFLRLRALALLGLNRFDEADPVVQQADDTGAAELRDFVASYPSLVFRQRLTLAHRCLQKAKADEAAEVLRGAQPTSEREAADLAYCQAFGLTINAYQLRRQQQDAEARTLFLQAMDALEPHLHAAGAHGQTHLVELYDRLEKDLETHARA